MEANKVNIREVQTNSFEAATTISKMNLSEVFADRVYLNEFQLFIAHFNMIPNYIEEREIDSKRANQWFLENYKSEINDCYYDKLYCKHKKRAELDDIFYLMKDDLIVYFDISCSRVLFLFRKTEIEKIDPIIKEIKKFKLKARRKYELSLLITSRNGINTKPLKIIKPSLNIDDNYNDDFKEIHQTIVKRLSKKNDKGLVLLHGKPGTGKTFYIRYLISSVRKNVIFLPPNMAGAITNPDLISILIDNPNSIFVIEDAENIVVDRDKDGRSPVSALLNISDGLLSDCLNIQIICSFNTDISKVDSALMRKGRLIAKYEFKELEVHKTQALSRKLGFDSELDSPMTLTAIYNQEEKDFQQVIRRNSMGFKANN